MHQPRHQLSAWGLSFCFHAIVLAAAIVILHDLPQPQPSMYRMEFLLTDPKSVTDAVTPQESTTVTEHPSPAAPSPSRTASTSSTHVIEQRSSTAPSIIQRPVNHVTTAAVAQRERNPSTAASDSAPVASPTPIERHVETLPSVTESSKPAAMNASQAVERPFMTASSQVAATLSAEPITENLQHGVSPSSLVASEISQHAAETVSSHLSGSANSRSSSPNDHSSSSQPTGESSVSPSQTDSEIADSPSPASQMDSGSPPATPQQTLVMNHLPIARTIPSRSDYGWLKGLLKRRIMSLQAYPHLARMQGWEGIVVVRATIKNDGRLLDAS